MTGSSANQARKHPDKIQTQPTMKQNTDSNPCPLKSPLVWISSHLLLLSLLFLSSCSKSAAPAEPISAKTVEAWLALLDQGDYAKSWETAGDGFRKTVAKNDWVAMAKQVRQPLGDLVSRKVKTTQQTEKLPDMPPGSYFVAVFDTSFAGMASAAETVIFTQEKKD